MVSSAEDKKNVDFQQLGIFYLWLIPLFVMSQRAETFLPSQTDVALFLHLSEHVEGRVKHNLQNIMAT